MPVIFVHTYGAFFAAWNVSLKATHLTCHVYARDAHAETESLPLQEHQQHDCMLGCLWDHLCDLDVREGDHDADADANANASTHAHSRSGGLVLPEHPPPAPPGGGGGGVNDRDGDGKKGFPTLFFSVMNTSTTIEKEEVGRASVELSTLVRDEWKQLWIPLQGQMEGARLGVRLLPEGFGLPKETQAQKHTRTIMGAEMSLFPIPKRQLMARSNMLACGLVALVGVVMLAKVALNVAPFLVFCQEDVDEFHRREDDCYPPPQWQPPSDSRTRLTTRQLLALTKARQQRRAQQQEEKAAAQKEIDKRVRQIDARIAACKGNLKKALWHPDIKAAAWILTIQLSELRGKRDATRRVIRLWEDKWAAEAGALKISPNEFMALRTAKAVCLYKRDKAAREAEAAAAKEKRRIPDSFTQAAAAQIEHEQDLRRGLSLTDAHMEAQLAQQMKKVLAGEEVSTPVLSARFRGPPASPPPPPPPPPPASASLSTPPESPRSPLQGTGAADEGDSLSEGEVRMMRGNGGAVLSEMRRRIDAYLVRTRRLLCGRFEEGLAAYEQCRGGGSGADEEDPTRLLVSGDSEAAVDAAAARYEASAARLFGAMCLQGDGEYVAWDEVGQLARALFPRHTAEALREFVSPWALHVDYILPVHPWGEKEAPPCSAWYAFDQTIAYGGQDVRGGWGPDSCLWLSPESTALQRVACIARPHFLSILEALAELKLVERTAEAPLTLERAQRRVREHAQWVAVTQARRQRVVEELVAAEEKARQHRMRVQGLRVSSKLEALEAAEAATETTTGREGGVDGVEVHEMQDETARLQLAVNQVQHRLQCLDLSARIEDKHARPTPIEITLLRRAAASAARRAAADGGGEATGPAAVPAAAVVCRDVSSSPGDDGRNSCTLGEAVAAAVAQYRHSERLRAELRTGGGGASEERQAEVRRTLVRRAALDAACEPFYAAACRTDAGRGEGGGEGGDEGAEAAVPTTPPPLRPCEARWLSLELRRTRPPRPPAPRHLSYACAVLAAACAARGAAAAAATFAAAALRRAAKRRRRSPSPVSPAAVAEGGGGRGGTCVVSVDFALLKQAFGGSTQVPQGAAGSGGGGGVRRGVRGRRGGGVRPTPTPTPPPPPHAATWGEAACRKGSGCGSRGAAAAATQLFSPSPADGARAAMMSAHQRRKEIYLLGLGA